jgi:hypothetical protein
MMQKFINGTPSFEDSNLLWKRYESDSEVTDEEFRYSYHSLREHIKKWCHMAEGLKEGFCYIRGDNFGDRTHYVELYLPELLNTNFLSYLQNWIKTFLQNWRILIPTYLTDSETIVIYSDGLVLGKKYRNMKLEILLREIVKKMREMDKNGVFLQQPVKESGVTEPLKET